MGDFISAASLRITKIPRKKRGSAERKQSWQL